MVVNSEVVEFFEKSFFLQEAVSDLQIASIDCDANCCEQRGSGKECDCGLVIVDELADFIGLVHEVLLSRGFIIGDVISARQKI
jgi:hypothetical protein